MLDYSHIFILWTTMVGGIIALFPMPANAQSPIRLNVEVPQMRVRICPTLNEAQTEAAMALTFGQGPYREGVLGNLRNQACYSVLAAVTPLKEEPTILPFVAWIMGYDPQSSSSIVAPAFGRDERIGMSAIKGEVRYYFGNMNLYNGQEISGWFEMPNRPYIIDYLNEKSKLQNE